ncbi:MAG: Fe-S cluster assembly protein SufD [Bacteroidia bacterium]
MINTEEKTGLKERLVARFYDLEKQLNGQARTHIHSLRRSALKRFEAIGFPNPRQEEWKYTNLRTLLEQDFQPVTAVHDEDITLEDIREFFIPEADADRLVFLNGWFSPKLSVIKDTAHVTVKPLSDAAEENPERIEEHFKAGSEGNEAFILLNTAYAIEGAYIHVPDGKNIEKPVHLLYINSHEDGPALAQPRTIIKVGGNSQVTLVESFHSITPQQACTNIFTEFDMAEGANVDYYKIQHENESSYHIGTTKVHQERNSTFASNTITLGGRLTRNNIDIKLNGEGCNSRFFGLFITRDKQHVDNHSLVTHASPGCFSNQLYKGVLFDRSVGVFDGRIIVEPAAQKTNAFQSNKNILMSDAASINSKPQLEIYADDVKCSHGATMGQQDEDAVFYLQTRGIDRLQAKALLNLAFVNDIVEQVKIASLKDRINEWVHERLDQPKSEL